MRIVAGILMDVACAVTDNIDRRTELLVVLTPRAIRSPDQARAVTEELRLRLRGLAALEERVR